MAQSIQSFHYYAPNHQSQCNNRKRSPGRIDMAKGLSEGCMQCRATYRSASVLDPEQRDWNGGRVGNDEEEGGEILWNWCYLSEKNTEAARQGASGSGPSANNACMFPHIQRPRALHDSYATVWPQPEERPLLLCWWRDRRRMRADTERYMNGEVIQP